MKRRAPAVAVITVVFIFFLTTIVLAEEFSADIINRTKERSFEGKVFVSGEKMRTETPESITITRLDKKLIWVLMPGQKMYMEQSFGSYAVMVNPQEISGEVERELIGQEVVGDRMASKYKIVYAQGDKKETMFQWIASGISMPVKTVAGDGSWITEYRNIKIEKQPDWLFEVPLGYKKFSPPISSMR